MTTIIIGIIFVVVGTLAYAALRSANDFSDANEIIPGVPTKAPKEWAGAHSPEARLHRRLRDAIEPLRANAALDGAGLDDVRSQLEQHALRIDEQLIAVSALPKGRREQPIDQVAAAVEKIEATVADVIALRGPAAGDLDQGISAVRTRLQLIEEARAELAALDRPGSDLSELRQQLDADADTSASPPGPVDPDVEPGTSPSA